MREILTAIKPLAAEYYRLTGKPLGVTSEVAETIAVDVLGLELAPPRTAAYDAIRRTLDGSEKRIQIKGRAFGADANPGQRLGRIKQAAACYTVLLVLLDNAALDLREMWTPRMPPSRSDLQNRDLKSVSVPEFKRLAVKIWATG
ncbi:hypothetical protein [Sinorhizobium medicae]|uniref:hypothetical protein n=1 Tax=Sinorhizobium medicae TaxID=110321 RepID=UPI0019129B9E|nr:hypothetical protein [Sinorhizobium medicae]